MMLCVVILSLPPPKNQQASVCVTLSGVAWLTTVMFCALQNVQCTQKVGTSLGQLALAVGWKIETRTSLQAWR